MRCAVARETMTQALREPLLNERSTALTAHLAHCAGCRAEQVELHGFEDTLRRTVRSVAGDSPVLHLNAREVAALANRTRAVKTRLRVILGGALATAAAVATLLVSTGPQVGTPRGAVATTKPTPSGTTALERHSVGSIKDRQIPRSPRLGAGSESPQVRHTSPRVKAPEQPIQLTTIPDSEYLNGADPTITAQWMTGSEANPDVLKWLTSHLPPVKDDFVSVPLPRLASTNVKSAAVRDAVKAYEKQAAVVDTRLFRKVTLQMKSTSLAEVCQALSHETGVRIATSRGLTDEKATVLVKERPAREVMREVARLFGYQWARSGEEGRYSYELLQDLRSQLAEEEMRSQDLNAALIALDAQVRSSVSDLDQTPAQLSARLQRATGPEKERLRVMLHGGWGIAQVYRNLAPSELTALRNGVELQFSDVSTDPERRLPPEWRQKLVQTSRDKFLNPETGDWIIPADQPDATVAVSVKISRSELGQLTLEGFTSFDSRSANFQGGIPRILATGRSPSTAAPENAVVNQQWKNHPAFQALVTLDPEPGCPGLKRWDLPAAVFSSGQPLLGEMRAPPAHLHSGEVWEEIHRRTGRPIVADSYTRCYEAAPLRIENKKLFDALCATGDALGVRWRPDGDYLLARSTAYFWDKVKEVPSRLIRRWQADAKMGQGLPVRDLFEMASLSDQQLDSKPVGEAMRRCYGLEEWLVVGGRPNQELRPWARFLSQLGPHQLADAFSPAGLSVERLLPNQQGEWLRIYHSPPNPGTRLRAEYVPAGAYVWMPTVPADRALPIAILPVLSARTVEEGLTTARRHFPGTKPSDFRRSAGVLSITVNAPGEEAFAYRKGKPPTLSGPIVDK